MIWRPHPGPQEYALQSTAFEILYGGARGGGKTDAGQVSLIKPYLLRHPRARSLVIRRSADDLKDWVDRARYMYARYGAIVVGNPPEIRFPSGYKIRTGHLRDDNAYTKYQGHEYQRILIEELTQIPQERQYLMLLGSCRSTIDIDPRIFNTTNPGNVGHGWVRARFIDPAPPYTKIPYEIKLPDGRSIVRSRIFIPAKVDDNPTIGEKDPGYIATLEMLKDVDPDTYYAWRFGDWDRFAGQYFKRFDRRVHLIPHYIPDLNKGYLLANLDWGRVDNFAFYLKHVFPVYYNGQQFWRVITFCEVYGKDKDPDEWAKIIIEKLAGYGLTLENITNILSDNQIFAPSSIDKGITIADMFYQIDSRYNGLLVAATKNRIAGWQNMQKWLSIAPDGLPYWQIDEHSVNLIRTLPLAVHDDIIVEDISQKKGKNKAEDDALDSERYGFSELKFLDFNVGGVISGSEGQIHTTLLEDKEIFDDEDDDDIMIAVAR